jgi:FkbM family methyltransferase
MQRVTGRKTNVRLWLNHCLRRPIEPDFEILRWLNAPAESVYVDIGANRGETVASVRMYLPSIRIVAFEPNAILADVINAGRSQDPRFTLHAVGLGEAPGTFDLYVPHYRGVAFDGLASFKYGEAAEWLSPQRIACFNPRSLEVRTVRCRIERLDSFALAPAFMKIDVQGLEAAVIAGGLATIERHLPIVLMENNRPEHDAAALLALGYEPYAYVAGKLVADTSYRQLNSIYVHPETRSLLRQEAYL